MGVEQHNPSEQVPKNANEKIEYIFENINKNNELEESLDELESKYDYISRELKNNPEDPNLLAQKEEIEQQIDQIYNDLKARVDAERQIDNRAKQVETKDDEAEYAAIKERYENTEDETERQKIKEDLTLRIQESLQEIEPDQKAREAMAEVRAKQILGITDLDRSERELSRGQLLIRNGDYGSALQIATHVNQNQNEQAFAVFKQAAKDSGDPDLLRYAEEAEAKEQEYAAKKAQQHQELLTYHREANAEQKLYKNVSAQGAKVLQTVGTQKGGQDLIDQAIVSNNLTETDSELVFTYGQNTNIRINKLNGQIHVGTVATETLEPIDFDGAYITSVTEEAGFDIDDVQEADAILQDVLHINTQDQARMQGEEADIMMGFLKGLHLKGKSSDQIKQAFEQVGIVDEAGNYQEAKGRKLYNYLMLTTRLDPVKLKNLPLSATKDYMAQFEASPVSTNNTV